MGASDGSAILADIGATNARFALLAGGDIVASMRCGVADYASPIEAIRAFLQDHAIAPPDRAVVAAAGPVAQGRVKLTNAAWTLDAEQLRRGLALERVRVLNDFEALGWALSEFQPADLRFVGGGRNLEGGTMAVLGPGSGFGLAAMTFTDRKPSVLVTEGGHATLSCENVREDAIVAALRERLHHVSVEAVLSGPGLVNLYEAVARVDGVSVPERSAEDIMAHGLAGDCSVSRATLDQFCSFLGSVAGNVALTLGAVGGMFIGGGIAPRFLEFLSVSSFRARFEAKGRFSDYLSRIPTAIIVRPDPAFVGLAKLAHEAR
ncbi:MAG: glucokinase [Enhydrobacter sp.]|nr:MAG: glucokinase [Enhydrobacter sp.]